GTRARKSPTAGIAKTCSGYCNWVHWAHRWAPVPRAAMFQVPWRVAGCSTLAPHVSGRLQTCVTSVLSWAVSPSRVEWDGSAGWQHTLHQYGDVFDASFTGFNDWLPVEGIGLSRNTTVLRAGLSLWPSRGVGLRLGYTGEQGQHERAGSLMLQGMLAF